MLHRTSMTARLSCLVGAAVLAAGLVCAVLSCDGIGASVNSDGGLYGGTSGNSGSDGMGGSGRTGAGSGGSGAGGRNFTAEDFLSHANAGNTDAILELLSDSGGNQAVGTFMVVLPAADIGLPAGGSVTLSITGDGYNYYGTAQDAGDGIVSFEAPCIAVGTTVTVTLEVMKADGSITATGTATQRVTEGGCNFSLAMTDTAPAPAPVPEGFVAVTGGTVSGQIADSQVFIAGRTVTIRNLYVCAHEVTQEEYTAVMGSNPSYFTGSPAAGEEQSKRPVEQVSWYDTLVYCNKRSMAEGLTACYTISGSTDPAVWGIVPSSSNDTWNAVTMDTSANGYRLPTEAEWEYAARGGDGGIPTPQTTYSGSDDPAAVAWYSGTSSSRTHEVMKLAPNSLGLYDMSGNVYKWCWDWYSSSVSGSTPDTGPAGSSSSPRVVRGGDYHDSSDYCTVSYRYRHNPYYRANGIGFRLVRSAQ